MPSERRSDAEPVIRLRGVGKSYRIYDRPIQQLWQVLRPGKRYGHELHALEGIDLDVARGETLGIVGRNGSGKSTLLRIVSGIMKPTRGEVAVRGRVAPLLSLGAGFHPQFSGRENIRLNAAILGLSDAEIEARFDDIAAFADIGEALDRLVSTYSSGMFARLAFAVAVCVDPEILVVDEILSVGDEAFSRKCFARIEEIKSRGATVLFVSHSASLVLELCDRAVLLERGRLLAVDTPREVVRRYHALLYTGRAEVRRPEQEAVSSTPAASPVDASAEGRYDSGLVAHDPSEYPAEGARIERLQIVGSAGQPLNRLRLGRRYTLEIEIAFDRDAEGVVIGFHFRNAAGVPIAGLMHPPVRENCSVHAGERITLRLPFAMSLLPGTYFVTAGVRSTFADNFLHRLVDAMTVVVDPIERPIHQGYVSIEADPPSLERSSAHPASHPDATIRA